MQTVEPFSVQVFNDTMLQVSSRFDNSQVTGAYFIQTIGLFAKLGDGDPVLFEVAQAITPDEMPAQSAVAPSAFVYNMQVTIQRASQLTVTVNPAGTATVQDILTLNATKVDIDGGDISNTIAATFEASNASWPIPAAGETIKVILGKIVKYFTDLNNWRSTVVLIANIVNNCTSTDTNKPLSANQGKVLMDGKAPKSHASTATTYGAGNASNYGHVKLSDNYTSSAGAASSGVGASSKAVADAYAKLNSEIDKKAPKSHASTATTYGLGNANNYGHVKLSDNYTSSAGAASAGVAASSKAVADAYAKLNSAINLLKTREYIDYSWNSNTCDAHVYKCGNILQIYLHVTYSPSGLNIGDLPAFTEREIYSVNADKWKPWVDVQKIPLICDSDAYPNCYFSFYADGTIKLGTRETAIPANANKHFYGFVCCIAKT